MKRLERALPKSSRAETALWISATSMCSCWLLLTNKVLVKALKTPLTLTFVQLLFAAFIVFPKVYHDGFTRMSKSGITYYVIEATLFALSLFANMKALMLTGVGSVIVGRSCVPVVTFAVEAFQYRNLPLKAFLRPVISLLGVSIFSFVYVHVDGKLQSGGLTGLYWIVSWVLIVALQMIYGKWLISAVPLKHWERVFYTNSFALPLLCPKAVQEYTISWYTMDLDLKTVVFIISSCFAGVGIGYSSWRLRALISPTAFGLVGVLNKMATIVFGVVLWPHEFSLLGSAAVIGCIAFGTFYRSPNTFRIQSARS